MKTRSGKLTSDKNSIARKAPRSGRVLADRTNRDGSPEDVDTRRPKRTNRPPSRFRDYEPSPVRKNAINGASAPVQVSKTESPNLRRGPSPIPEPTEAAKTSRTVPKSKKPVKSKKPPRSPAKSIKRTVENNPTASGSVVKTVTKSTKPKPVNDNKTSQSPTKSIKIPRSDVRAVENDPIASGSVVKTVKKSTKIKPVKDGEPSQSPTTSTKSPRVENDPIVATARTPIYKRRSPERTDVASATKGPYDFFAQREDDVRKVNAVKKKRGPTKKTAKSPSDFSRRADDKNKKEPIKKTTRRKKMLSRKSTEAAMKLMLEDIKKIREERMMKKLAAKIKSRNAPLPVATEDRTAPEEQIAFEDHHEDVPADNFDQTFSNPIANSTFANGPSSSPWRLDVETSSRPRKYVFHIKPSMTPAYERNDLHEFELGNLGNEKTPNPDASGTERKSNLKQTSILSFWSESVKCSNGRRSAEFLPSEPSETSGEAEPTARPSEPALENFFGFGDDSAEVDQENVSPNESERIESSKKILRANLIKRKSPVLREINARSKKEDFVRDILNNNRKEAELKSSEIENITTNDSDESSVEISNEAVERTDDDRLVLFEDPAEVVHHSQTFCRTYEKRSRPTARSVKFQNVEIPTEDEESGSDPETLEDTQYIISSKKVKKRKTNKKAAPKQMSKKEEKEANEWAESFNSMLNEADGFELCIDKSGITDLEDID